MTALKNVFGSQVRQRRIDRGWSQAELARRLGMHQPDLCDLENGKHAPTLETVQKIAETLEIPAGELLAENFPELGLTD